jgi:hypothetical protein
MTRVGRYFGAPTTPGASTTPRARRHSRSIHFRSTRHSQSIHSQTTRHSENSHSQGTPALQRTGTPRAPGSPRTRHSQSTRQSDCRALFRASGCRGATARSALVRYGPDIDMPRHLMIRDLLRAFGHRSHAAPNGGQR